MGNGEWGKRKAESGKRAKAAQCQFVCMNGAGIVAVGAALAGLWNGA